jgi:hypothetical protein
LTGTNAEITLALDAIDTAGLPVLSGIGDPAELRRLGVAMMAAVPGKNLAATVLTGDFPKSVASLEKRGQRYIEIAHIIAAQVLNIGRAISSSSAMISYANPEPVGASRAANKESALCDGLQSPFSRLP